MKCDIEIFLDGAWRTTASFEPLANGEVAKGIQGAGFLEYDLDFAETIRRLPEIMDECGVDGWLIQRLVRRIDAVARSLDAARPRQARPR